MMVLCLMEVDVHADAPEEKQVASSQKPQVFAHHNDLPTGQMNCRWL
jgi:hypothetical protein